MPHESSTAVATGVVTPSLVSPFSNHLITVAGHYALEEQPEEGLNFDSPAPPRALADTRHTPQVSRLLATLAQATPLAKSYRHVQ
jgi:hypothetical protein